jgi:type IX secretion system PorP/SprF family membrane protein
MTKLVKCIFFCCMLCCRAGLVVGQDIHFSQFFEAPLLRNPALAGIFTGDIRVQGVYRDQWNSFTNAYRTGSLNGEYRMPVGKGDDFMTIGLQMLFDKAGTVGLTTTHLLPAVNYHKSLSDERPMYLSVGFMGGMIRKSIDISKMTTDEQYLGGFNPGLSTGETVPASGYYTWDASTGISFNSAIGANHKNTVFAGLAYHHVNRPRNSFYRNVNIELKPKFVISGGFRLVMDEYSFFTIQADHSSQGPYRETIAGAMYGYNLGPDPENAEYKIHLGAFLRWEDAVIPVIKLERAPVAISLSYDVNVSRLKTASQGMGGIELSLSYIGFVKRDNSSKYKMLCPRF